MRSRQVQRSESRSIRASTSTVLPTTTLACRPTITSKRRAISCSTGVPAPFGISSSRQATSRPTRTPTPTSVSAIPPQPRQPPRPTSRPPRTPIGRRWTPPTRSTLTAPAQVARRACGKPRWRTVTPSSPGTNTRWATHQPVGGCSTAKSSPWARKPQATFGTITITYTAA